MWMIGVGACSLALPMGMLVIDPIVAAPPKSSRQSAQAAEATSDSTGQVDADEPSDPAAEKRGMVRLNYVESSWEKVLKDVAAATDTSLVADYIPKKKFSRWDLKRHTKAEALKILNQELEPQNFRLQFKGRFLVLNQMRDLRHEYPAAILRGDPHDRESGKTAPDDAETPPPAARAKRAASTASRSRETPGRSAKGRSSPIQLASGEEENSRPDSDRTGEYDQQPVPVETAVPLRSQKAGTIANRVYRAFGTQAEKTDEGPQGLRGFVVRRLPPGKRAAEGVSGSPVQFSVGVDNNRNELIVAASPAETKSIVKLIKTLDNVPKTADGAGTTRIVKTKRDAAKLATALQPELNRLAQATRTTSRRAAQTDDADDDDDMPARRAPARNQDRPEDAEEAGGERSLFGSLKADVLVESVPELGILVIRGNQSDVEAVEKVIEEIERLSVQTAPRVKLAILRHISSEALASLLTSVYERLAGARNSAVQQSQAISVFPVARPNAVLIVASNADIDAVFTLIDELDQQSNPSTEFMVFQLKSAVPSQVVDKVEALYPPPTAAAAGAANAQQNVVGLVPRVRIIDDLRTNSVIVQARPRDLREIALLIEKLDVEDTKSKQQIKIFPLTNAVADEVAFTLSSSIQNVLGPSRATAAPTTGQPGGQGGAFGAQAQGAGAAGQGSTELREVKSTILEFLDKNGDEGRDLRSGILSDIRMTADLRTNSIVVTAPRGSMAFVARLIEQLDRPSATVAEIKVFKLSNADATSVQTLLERLFGIQRTGQQGGQGGGAGGQQQGVPGLLVADAEDSSSMLIPLRFSVDVRTNSIIAIGGGGALNVVEAVVLKLDESDIRQRQNEVYRLKNAPATNVATAISQFLQTQQQILTADPGIISPFEQIEREVIVVPEPTSNSLLISATPRFFKDIKELIVSIDRTPRQVLIQGLIVEVSLTNTDEFGMELGLQDSILFRRSPIPTPVTVPISVQAPNGNTTTTNNIISESATPGYLFGPAAGAAQTLGNNTSANASNPMNVAGQAVTGFGTALSNGQLGYGGLVLQAGSENVNFLLRALAVRTRVDVLSRPQIRTVDNQFSQIQVGQEIPRVNGFSSNGTAGVIVPTVQQRAIGIILQVTPRISPDGLVIMEVVARKDSLSAQQINLGVSAAGTAVTSPIVNTTNAQTVIAVNSGQTVILGGMITKNDDVEERKVPVLGDIPLLGRFFRYDYKQMLRTELLIFLTPRIINDDEEAEMFKQIEAERLNFIESEAERMHGPLYGMPENSAPGMGPGSPAAPPSPTGPGLLPNPPVRGKQISRPPDASIPGPATTDRSPEPYPMPGADADDAGPGASLMRNDEEDLDEPFVQAKFQSAKKGDAAAGGSAAAKSTAKSTAKSSTKSGDKTQIADKTKNRFLKKKKPTKKTAEQQEAEAASDDP
jgi:type II secretion system protein D